MNEQLLGSNVDVEERTSTAGVGMREVKVTLLDDDWTPAHHKILKRGRRVVLYINGERFEGMVKSRRLRTIKFIGKFS